MKWFDELDKVVRIILFIPIWGWIFSGIYRIVTYVNNKNSVATLIIGILCVIPVAFVGFIFSIIDLVTTITDDKVKVLAE